MDLLHLIGELSVNFLHAGVVAIHVNELRKYFKKHKEDRQEDK